MSGFTRLTIVATTLLSLTVCLFAQDAPPAEQDVPMRYHGVVFADANANGKLDEGEKPIAGVRVGNFWKTVLTDKQGRYDFESVVKRSLTPPEVPVIFVALPAGFSIYRSEDRFRFVEWKDRKDFEADFALKPDPATLEKDFCWIAASDAKYEDMVRRFIPYLNGMDRSPRFLLTTGDTFLGSWGENTWKKLVADHGDGALAQFRSNLAELNAQSRVPIINVLGNHHGMWQQLQGAPCFSFNWGGVVFICRGTWQVPSHAELKKIWQTLDAQNEWVRREVSLIPEGTPVVWAGHYRPGDSAEEKYRMEHWANWQAFAERRMPILGMFWGHSHRAGTQYINHDPFKDIYGVNLPAAELHSLRDREYTPYGFFLCGIRDGKFWTSYEIEGEKDFLEVISPAEGATVPAEFQIVVNAGGVLSTVKSMRCMMDDREIELTRSGRYAWTGMRDHPPVDGEHKLHVEATTLGGKVWTKDVTFNVGGDAPVAKPGAAWAGPGGNDANSGDVGATGKAPLSLAWSADLGAPVVQGGAVIVDGKVYLHRARYSLDQPTGIVVLDAATGKRVDAIDLADLDLNHLAQAPLEYAGGRLLTSNPYVAFTWSYGTHHAVMIDRATKQRIWQDNPIEGQYVMSQKFLGDTFLGSRYSTNGKKDAERVPFKHVALFDANERKELWRSEVLWSEPGHYDMVNNGFETPAVDREAGRVYTTVACLSLANGKTIWKHDQSLFTYPDARVTNVALTSRCVFAHGFAWDRETGKELWAHPQQDPGRHRENYRLASWTAATDDAIVFAWSNGVIEGRNPATGDLLWEKKSELELTGGLAVMGGAVYAVSKEGVVLGLDLKTGAEAWRKSLGAPIFAYPAASGNTLYLVDWGGRAYAFGGK